MLNCSTDSFTAGLTVSQSWIRDCSGRGNDMAVSVTECEVVSIENNLIASLTVPVCANHCKDYQ
ncbi:hypothetical protein [Veronia pacifica]|uniref:hypothetical protein n=1 Tax=Veronia pacifica TaxID=1080227 RepID=UPI00111301BE|nr:hypothetical protein [Veronia pacifica]